jgi:hypothetical protein
MRFIIHELPFEKPLAAGQWRYHRDGRPTGAVESWRLTAAQDGYRFLRIDLDARAAESGRSILYHLTLDPQGKPVQLRYRLWTEGPEITGMALFEAEDLILVTEQAGQRVEEVLPLPPEAVFWFPSSTALGLLVDLPQAQPLAGVYLRLPSDKNTPGLQAAQATVIITSRPLEQRVIMGKVQDLEPVSIWWEDQERRLWVDATRQPLRMARQDGLAAVETELINYQRRIREPGDNGR